MANLLAEQFLKAGLVDKDKLKNLEKQKHKGKKAKTPKKEIRRNAEKNKPLSRPKLTEEQKLKVQHDKALSKLQQEKNQARAIQAEIKQLVVTNKIDRSGGDVDYQYGYKGKIRKMLVTNDLRAQLVQGSMLIVNLDGQFEIVPKQVAVKIAERRPTIVIGLEEEKTVDHVDDAYADFQVPDDLIW